MWVAVLALMACLACDAEEYHTVDRTSLVGSWAAGEMRCTIWVVEAEDHSAIGLFVDLAHTAAGFHYSMIEGRGAAVSLRAVFQAGTAGKGQWRDPGPPLPATDAPTYRMAFSNLERYRYYIPLAAILTGPLPADVVTECDLEIRPDFHVAATRRKETEEWIWDRKDFASGKARQITLSSTITLRRAALESGAWRYPLPAKPYLDALSLTPENP